MLNLEALDERVVPASGAISGHVLQDLTGNGLSSDDTGLGNVTVNLYRFTFGGASLVGSQPSAADGSYSFGNLSAGWYGVTESVPGGEVLTAPTPGSFRVVHLNSWQQVGGQDFDNFLKPVTSTVTGISYTVTQPNGTSTTVTNLRGNTQQGDTVTASFTVTGSSPVTLSLVSYNAPWSSFNAYAASRQTILADSTGTFSPGQHSLMVQLPNNFYQVDFVVGAAIDHFGPAGGNIFYSAQGRLLSADNGGTHPLQRGNLWGAVTDSSGNVLAGASVTVTNLANNAQTVVTTNSKGVYRVNALQAGLNYSVAVSDANFVSQTRQIALTTGTNTANFSLVSQAGATLTGTVTDAGNVGPISGATVTLTDSTGATIASTTTGTDGKYTFTSLQLGSDTITVSDTGFIKQSTGVTLFVGTNTDNISLQQAAAMSGVVTDSNNNPITSATVTVSENGQTFTATTGSDGSYTISGLTPGTVNVTVSASGFTPVTTQVTLKNGTNNDSFALGAQQAELSGVVTDPNNTPVNGATINVVDSSGFTVASTMTAPDGSYSFNGIPPGTYTITGTFTDNVTDTLLKGSVSGVVLGTGVTVNLQLQAV
jgi:hypothetical protein